MKKLQIILLASIISIVTEAQLQVGTWRDHFSFKQGLLVDDGNDKVYVSSNNGIFWYSKQNETIGKITRVNGLSDVGVTAIKYLSTSKTLLVGYENGNLDLVFEREVVNLPYVLDKPMMGSKRINHFYFLNGAVYVSTGFGIILLNVDKKEISDTYFLGEGGEDLWVNQVIEYGGKLFAATSEGIYSAWANDPLLFHYASWTHETDFPNFQRAVTSLALFDGKLFASQSSGNQQTDDILFYDSFSNVWNVMSSPFIQIRSITSSQQQLIVCSRQGIAFYDSAGQYTLMTYYGGHNFFYPNQVAVGTSGDLSVADNHYGLMFRKAGVWKQVCPNSPGNDRTYYVLPTETDVQVAGGSRNATWGNIYYPLIMHTLSANQQWNTISNSSFFDAVRIAKSPFYENEYYIASWGHGVLVYRDGELTKWHSPLNPDDEENSTLESIFPGQPFCRIGGIVFDSNNNLWVSNAGVQTAISVRLADGTWKGFPYLNFINAPRLSDITIAPDGNLWVTIPSGGGFFVLNPGENPGLQSSHTHRRFVLSESDGSLLPNDIQSVAFDREGVLWVGTAEGVLVSYNPDKVFEPSAFSVQKVRIPDVEPGLAVYLLETESVTSIAVDGGNRKWFGTSRSGVFLQSADGSKQLLNFNTGNSPLPSNTIQHIAIHPVTGEVFIATEKGLVSYRGEANEPSNKFDKVYAFPNPVRPNYNGLITITGLVDKTIVKITDVSGNLVYETRSLGGQVTWDGKNMRGQKVSTGVYLYFCADSKGEQSYVGKLLFVK